MANFTIELRELGWELFNSKMQEYPLYEKINREDLNRKIYNHYMFRETCDTAGRFFFLLKRTMNEIMPTYNRLYKALDVEFNPLYNVDMKETYTHTITSEGKTNTNKTNNNTNSSTTNIKDTGEITNVENQINIHSNTPQGNISIDDIKSNKYASETDNNNNESKNTNSSTTNTTNTGESNSNSTGSINSSNKNIEEYTKTQLGSSAGLPFSKAMEQYDKYVIRLSNIDMRIIDDLESCFFQLW